jgi:hypothetical protein
MRRAAVLTSRFVVMVAVIAALGVIAQGPASHGPYVSALTDLAATSAQAAPSSCNNKGCGQGPRLSFKCVDHVGTNCTSNHFDCGITAC